MKVVLCHQSTGRYYQSPGQWVRRADNALAFEDINTALQFSRDNHLDTTIPVHRLAPYVMWLLKDERRPRWQGWTHDRSLRWHAAQVAKSARN